MLRALLSALMGAWRFIWGVVTLPLRLFGGGGGQSAIAPPDYLRGAVEQEKEIAQEVLAAAKNNTPSPVLAKFLEAATVARWAAGRTAGAHRDPAPKDLPPSVRSWADQLKPDELNALAAAGYKAVCAHLARRQRIDGVPTPGDLTKSPATVRPATAVRRSRQLAFEPAQDPLESAAVLRPCG
jgi:hypothetical protein